MNKIYKVVWSKVKNCYVVVSELAKNVITGSVKSAKIGSAPVAKGLALGTMMAFIVTGNAWAAWPDLSGIDDALNKASQAATTAGEALTQVSNLRKGIEVGIDSEGNATGETNVTGNLNVVAGNGKPGNLSVAGATALTGNLTVGVNKFVVDASSGNVTAGFYNGLNVRLGVNDSDTAIVIGPQGTYAANSALAIGYKAEANGAMSTAIGYEAKTTGEHALAVGLQANASKNGVAIGDVSYAGENGTALGVSAKANAANSVAIGNSSVANQELTVSVGSDSVKRRIVNVAEGTLSADSHDVVIGSQLFAVDAAYKAADTKLSEDLTKAFGDADTALKTKVTNAYVSADTKLSEDLTKAFGDADTALKTEVTNAYVSADTKLSEDLTKAFGDADTALKTEVTDAYVSADTKLSEDLTKAFGDADTALKTEVTDAYKAADSALKTTIDANLALKADANDVYTKFAADEKFATKTSVTDLTGRVSTLDSLAIKNGQEVTNAQTSAWTKVTQNSTGIYLNAERLHDNAVGNAYTSVGLEQGKFYVSNSNRVKGEAAEFYVMGSKVGVNGNFVVGDDFVVDVDGNVTAGTINGINLADLAAKKDVTDGLDAKANASDVYTKNQTEEVIANKLAASGVVTNEALADLGKKTYNISKDETVPGTTVISGDVNIVADAVNDTAGNLTVAGNVQAATFNGIDLKTTLDKKIDNVATGNLAIGIGSNSVASGLTSVGIGFKAEATDVNAIGIGRESKATGNGAIGIGGGAKAIAEKAIVVGSFSKASGYGSVGIGTQAQASGKNSIAIGVGYPDSGLALLAKGESSIAIGTVASAEDDYSTAVGNWALAKGKNSLALGSGAKANYENSVALGAGSVTTAADTVSFGNATTQRKLQYVAAGEVSENSTDAVNGGQLYATNERVGALETNTAGISRNEWTNSADEGIGEFYTKVTDDFVVDTQEGKGKVTIGYIGENEMLFTQNKDKEYTFGVNAQTGEMQANGGAEFGYIEKDAEGNKVYNVEMNATGVAIKSGFSAVGGKVEVKVADDESALITVNAGTENQVVIGATGITVGLNSTHMDDDGVYAGGHNYNDAYAAIMANGRIKGANGAFTVDDSGNVIGGTYNGVNVVETANQVAINKDNIKTNADNIATNSTKIEQNANDIARVEREYKEADVALKSGYETADATLKSEVTDAYTQADATLKSEVTDAYTQADATLKSEVTDAYTQADATLKSEVTDAYTQADATLKSEVTDAYIQADATLKSEVEQGYKAADAKLQKDIAANTEAISGLNDRVTTNESDIAQNAADIAANKTAIESNTKLIEDMDAAYKAADKALQDNIDAEKAEREAADAQTLTDAKAYADEKDAALNNKISDVEAAYKAADKALENKIADVADAYVAADKALKEEVEAGYKAEDAKLQTQVNEVKQQAALNDRVNQVQNTQIAQLQSENIAQNNAIADLEKTKADKTYVDEVKEEVEAGYKAADEALKAEVTEAYTKADEALKAEVTEAYTKADEEIKADVKANTEAIEANATAIGNVQEQADANSNAINGLNQRLGKMNGKINKVGAGAAALAALHPLDYDPDDKLTFSAGVGNYAGENAAALGAFYRPDEKLMFSLGGTMGNGENMVNLGVSIGLDGAKGAPKLSRKEMIEKVSTVEAENKNLKAENEALAERVARLERIVVALTEKEQTKEK